MNQRLPKSLRIRARWQYQSIALKAKRMVGHWIIIDFKPNKQLPTRLGITVSRHYGKAVVRNRFKRVVREAFRMCHSRLQSGMDINVKPRNPAYQASPADIMTELLGFFEKPSSL